MDTKTAKDHVISQITDVIRMTDLLFGSNICSTEVDGVYKFEKPSCLGSSSALCRDEIMSSIICSDKTNEIGQVPATHWLLDCPVIVIC
jgi:hypothetical protein